MIYSTALPLTLPSLTSDQRQHLLKNRPLLSLYEVFATIPDPRSTHGLRYELAYLLTCLVAGLLCNANSTLAIAQWGRDQRILLTQLFGPRCFLCPCDSSYRKLFFQPRCASRRRMMSEGSALTRETPGTATHFERGCADGLAHTAREVVARLKAALLSNCTHRKTSLR